MNAERKAAVARRLGLQPESRLKPKVVVARGRLIEVDIANGVEVLEKDIPVMILEADGLLAKIELPGKHEYTLLTRQIESGQAGMMHFHEIGQENNS